MIFFNGVYAAKDMNKVYALSLKLDSNLSFIPNYYYSISSFSETK